jgi:hypothetical protein
MSPRAGFSSVTREDVPRLLPAADLGLLLRKSDAVNAVASPVKFGEYLACGRTGGDFAGGSATTRRPSRLIVSECACLWTARRANVRFSLQPLIEAARHQDRSFAQRCPPIREHSSLMAVALDPCRSITMLNAFYSGQRRWTIDGSGGTSSDSATGLGSSAMNFRFIQPRPKWTRRSVPPDERVQLPFPVHHVLYRHPTSRGASGYDRLLRFVGEELQVSRALYLRWRDHLSACGALRRAVRGPLRVLPVRLGARAGTDECHAQRAWRHIPRGCIGEKNFRHAWKVAGLNRNKLVATLHHPPEHFSWLFKSTKHLSFLSHVIGDERGAEGICRKKWLARDEYRWCLTAWT